jgi:Arc/MetJ-type ribon-helix-helix transcriptional regulator
MTKRTVVVRLNKQQLELVDRSVAEMPAADRQEVIRRSLREFHQLEFGPAQQPARAPASPHGDQPAPRATNPQGDEQ